MTPQHVTYTIMSTIDNNTSYPEQFADIAPYDDSLFHEKLQGLIAEPGFEHAIKYVMPNVDYPAFCQQLMSIKTQKDFQHDIMLPFLHMLEAKTTDGITTSGLENVKDSTSYTFLSNHRDIVLDASFLNVSLVRAGKAITQIAIGNNLLIFDWIADLVKLNRSFIVKRNIKKLEALAAARQLSQYIHHTIADRHESVWIAQREGRAKDSNDRTQESLIKMLSLGADGNTCDNLLDINILPVSISYEYDPNDYLKVREFLHKRRDSEFKKSQHDDLLSMETGLMGYKGRVHYHFSPCINTALQASCQTSDRNTVVRNACQLIDSSIHRGYHFYPSNYIAYDLLFDSDKFVGEYSQAEIEAFENYLNGQLAKLDMTDITDEELTEARRYMLTMYSNPIVNNLAVAD